MKKFVVLLLVFVLLLPGCGSNQPNPTEEPTTATDPTEATATTHPTEATVATQPVTVTQPTTAPASTEPTQPFTEAPTAAPTQATAAPTKPTTKPAQAPTQKPTAKPTQAPTQKPTVEPTQAPTQKPTVKPTTPTRPTSNATSRDTGSDEIWVDPSAGGTNYYQESDPERKSYLEYLKVYGVPYLYWITESSMVMRPGCTYGIPLSTSYEYMMETVWESSDPTIATVNEVGFVTALKAGTVVITATLPDPDPSCVTVRECTIYIEEPAKTTYAQLEKQAKALAKEIAEDILRQTPDASDLEHIAIAAGTVNRYVAGGVSTSNVGGYNQPFGTLITGYSSCAGSTRALGLILEYMGFEWYHANEGQWDHQWCIVYDVDGKTAFADGSWIGLAGYGDLGTDQAYEYLSGAGLSPYTGQLPI